MAEEKRKQKIIERLKNKYRLKIYNDVTLEEVTNFRLSRLNLFAYLGVIVIIIGVIVFYLLVNTRLSAFLPTYTDTQLKRSIVLTAMKVDSLENQIKIRDQYFSNIRNIIEGKELTDLVSKPDSSLRAKNIKFTKSAADAQLRKQIEEDELLNTKSAVKKQVDKNSLTSLHFFSPVTKGYITSKFNNKEQHYGIDIVSAPNEGVKATLDGTVISASWTLETGYVIQIQHENDLISLYKHNSALLKKTGDRVKAGEVIAIIGNSGELTTGPHLHFELWHKGVPVNPEAYIIF